MNFNTMSLKFSCLAIVCNIILSTSNAQINPGQDQPKSTNSQFISSEYDRCGITYVSVDAYKESRFLRLVPTFKTKLQVPDKFFDNRIADPVIFSETLASVQKNTGFNSSSKEKQIKATMESIHVPNKILDVIFASDGKSWKLDSLLKRGQYNMTDDQVMLLKNSAKGFTAGSENAIWSERILKKSFILAFTVQNIQSMDEIYDRQDARNEEMSRRSKGKIPYKPVPRLLRGYRGSMNAYCYKVAINDSLMNVVWMNFSEKNKRDAIPYPLSLEGITSLSIESTEPRKTLYPKSDDALFDGLVNGIEKKALDDFEDIVPDFRVRAPLVSVRPAEAKIGLKEGVHLDQRYFVYENVLKNGVPITVRRGVIRAKTIFDNRIIATGQTGQSKFYQVAGGRLDPGMLIEQKNDLGLSAFFGSAIPTSVNVNLFTARISLNISPSISPTGASGTPSQVRIFADFDVYSNPGTDSLIAIQKYFGDVVKSNKMNAIGFGLGAQRDLHFLHYFQFSPFASLNYNIVTYSDSALNSLAEANLGKEWGRNISLKAGAELGVNLYHNFKFVVSGFANTLFKNPDWELTSKGKASESVSNRIKPGLMLNVKLRYDL